MRFSAWALLGAFITAWVGLAGSARAEIEDGLYPAATDNKGPIVYTHKAPHMRVRLVKRFTARLSDG